MLSLSRSVLSVGLLIGAVCACQTVEADVTAALASDDAETLASVKSALAEALDRTFVELGPQSATDPSVLSVLPLSPGPLETHSTAMPDYFDLMLRDGACYAIERKTGTAHLLEGVVCRPLS